MQLQVTTLEQEPTLEQLPKAVAHLTNEFLELKKFLLQKHEPPTADQWFNLNELCNYLPEKPSKATVYGWVYNRIIPCYKRGKNLGFLQSEIDVWLKTGRKKTVAETAAEADNFLQSKTKKG